MTTVPTQRRRTGTRKLAQGNQEVGRDITQYCIDGYLVDEVLTLIPSEASIIGAKVFIGQAYSKFKKAIPAKLTRLGVTSLREHKPAMDATLTFDEVSKTTIRRNVSEACKIIGTTTDKAYFLYVTLRNGTSTGKFVHTTKDRAPDDSDLRKKVRVLGLEDVDGDTTNIIRTLSAKRYTCRVQTQTVRTIVCTS